MKKNRVKYNGIQIPQAKGTLEAFEQLLSDESFDRLIEFGTGRGMLTLFLSNIFEGELYTFDIHKRVVEKQLENNGVKVITSNIFETDTIEVIKKLMVDTGRVLLLCDNGNKIKEVNTFAKYLKTNDVIMAHDYANSRSTHNRGVWPSCEITEKDVRLVSKRYNLKPFHQDKFVKLAWMIKIKEE